MSFTDTSVPKQYVIVQETQPDGQFSGQIWYNPNQALTYIYQADEWKLITLDISSEVQQIFNEIIVQELNIIELQANAEVTPIDHDTLLSDTFSDADGYKDSVNTENTTANFNTNKYARTGGAGFILTTNLDSYYNLDEESGTNVLDIHGENNLTSANATLDETGILEKSYLMNTGGSKIDVLNLLKGRTKGTIQIWFKKSTHEAKSLLNIHQTATWVYFDIDVLSDGKVRVSQNNNGTGSNSINLSTSNAFSTTNWNHLVFDWDENGMRLTLNGTETTNATAFFIPNAGNDGRIGSKPEDGVTFGGYIDEFGLWNERLTTEEISALNNSGNGLSYDDFIDDTPPETKKIFIDLPTITGTITATQLIINGEAEDGAEIKYILEDEDEEKTSQLNLNTKNIYLLSKIPTKLEIDLIPKTIDPTNGSPSVKTYCLKLWKA
jgi:hypothetical protein